MAKKNLNLRDKAKKAKKRQVKSDHVSISVVQDQLEEMDLQVKSLEGLAAFLEQQLLGSSQEMGVSQASVEEDFSVLDVASVTVQNTSTRLAAVINRVKSAAIYLNTPSVDLDEFLGADDGDEDPEDDEGYDDDDE